MAKERVQVQGLGEAPTVQPVDLPGFQYGITQRRAGTNKLLQLAGDLEKIGMIGKQYSQLQVQQERIGAEQAELVEEQNVINELRKTKDIGGFSPLARYNRDRAYRDVLLKRAVNNSLIPQLEADTDDLLNLDSFKTRADFEGNLDQYMDKQWSSFAEQVGESAASSTAAKALWSTVSTPYKNKLSLAYEEKKQKAVELGLQDELAFTLSNVTRDRDFDTSILADIASNFEEVLTDSGVDKGQRNRLIIDGYAATIDKLYAQRRYTDAKKVLDAVGTIRVKGKPIFGTKEAERQLTPLLSKVNTKLNEVGTNSTTEARDILKGRIFSVLSSGVRDKEDMPPAKLATMKAIFTSMTPELTEEEVNQYIDKVFEGPGDIGQSLLTVLDEVAATSDLAGSLYYRINDDVIKEYSKIKEGFGVTPIALTEENIEKTLEEFRLYVQDNPEEDDPWKGFLSQEGGRIPKFQALIDESKTLTAGNFVLKEDYYKNIPERIRENLKAIEDKDQFTKEAPLLTAGVYLPSSISYIKKEVKKEAFKLAGEDPDVRDAILEELTNKLIKEERERFEGMAVASTIEFEKEDQVDLMGLVGPAREKTILETYPSLRPIPEKSEDVFSLRLQIEQDREKMVSAGGLGINLLKTSIARYGFTQWSPKNVELLEKAELDAADARLFASSNQFDFISGEWLDIIEKDIRREELTEEEKEARKLYNRLGIYDIPSWEDYYNVQKTYY